MSGCVVAARLDGVWGAAAALIGFAGYLILFARGLDQLPFGWNSWRERNFNEFDEEADDRNGRSEESNGRKT